MSDEEPQEVPFVDGQPCTDCDENAPHGLNTGAEMDNEDEE